MKAACSALAVVVCLGAPASAISLSELADQCLAAVEANDTSAFKAAADAIRKRDDVFDAAALQKAEKCLSLGYGEPWEYWYPSDSFEPVAAVEARMAATAAAKRTKEQAKLDAQAEADRLAADQKANAERVATLVYASCASLLQKDEVAAMTNSVCVESFLRNGLPDL